MDHPFGRYYSISDHKIWIETEGWCTVITGTSGPGFGHNYFHPWLMAIANKRRVIYFDPYVRGKSDHAQNRRNTLRAT